MLSATFTENLKIATMAHKLDIWLLAHRIGTLACCEGRWSFQYLPEWLARPDAVALSASLPLQAEAFADARTRPFFAGLLPEGQMGLLLPEHSQAAQQGNMALSERIGREFAGAVTWLEPGQAMPARAPGDQVRWLSDGEVAAVLKQWPSRRLPAGSDGGRQLLERTRDGLPVVFDGRRIGLPLNGAFGSHGLKPAIAELKGSVFNEAFCLMLALVMGLRPAVSSWHSVQGHSFLLVERYDRVVNEDGVARPLHREDFCQALGVPPERKFQKEGGPGLAQCFALLRKLAHPDAPQILRLLDYVIFNALIGNHAAHGRHFSLLYFAAMPVLAPLHDTLSTAVYADSTLGMAMEIGGRYRFSELQARHWQQFAREAGLGEALVERRVLELAASLPPAARKLKLDRRHGFAGHAVVGRVVALIEQRCERTIRCLTDAAR